MGRVTFLTGASSGLGSALAPKLADDGDAVALVARRKEPLDRLVHEIEQFGGRAIAIPCDVQDKAAVQAAVQQCVDTFGPVDRLIANAGIGIPTPASKFNTEDLEKTFQVNVMGAAYCIEAVLPSMLERSSGHIVGISSLAGYRGLPASGAYCASKAALTSLLESLRLELQTTGVSVTTICPGFVKTAMTDSNKFPMPFLMELEDGVRHIQLAIDRKLTHYAFPWQLATVVRLGRLLPNSLYDKILKDQKAAK